MNAQSINDQVNLIVDAALQAYSTDEITAYQIATIVNATLAYLESDEKVVSQAVYNATKTLRAKSNTGHLSIADARTVAIRIVLKKLNGSAPKSANVLETIKAIMDQEEQVEA